MTIKYYIGEIIQREDVSIIKLKHTTKYVFKTNEDPKKYAYKVLSSHIAWVGRNHRGGGEHEWDEYAGGYRMRHYYYRNLICNCGDCEELTKEEYDVLSRYLSVM